MFKLVSLVTTSPFVLAGSTRNTIVGSEVKDARKLDKGGFPRACEKFVDECNANCDATLSDVQADLAAAQANLTAVQAELAAAQAALAAAEVSIELCSCIDNEADMDAAIACATDPIEATNITLCPRANITSSSIKILNGKNFVMNCAVDSIAPASCVISLSPDASNSAFAYADSDDTFASFEGIKFSNFANSGGGGAFILYGGQFTFSACQFIDNSSDSEGGAIVIRTAMVDISDSIFSGNTARAFGGAIGTTYSSNATGVVANIANSVFFDNVADIDGDGYGNGNDIGIPSITNIVNSATFNCVGTTFCGGLSESSIFYESGFGNCNYPNVSSGVGSGCPS